MTVLLAELVVGVDIEEVGIKRHFRLQGVSGKDALDFQVESSFRTCQGA